MDYIEKIKSGATTAFIDSTNKSSAAYKPDFISNDHTKGVKVLTSIEEELKRCDSFTFSVAFITLGGIEPLLLTFKELEERGVPGKVLTTDYNMFTDPKALDKLAEFKGTTMLSDIGNSTMNIMIISNGKPNPQKCYTEKYGTYQCMLSIREQLMRKFGTAIDDDVIDDALRYGTADISEKYLTVIREVARQYVAGIMRRLREHEYNPELMKLYIVGGGGCLIRNFGEYDPNRVTINDDIRATAKGYEFLANLKLKKANAA